MLSGLSIGLLAAAALSVSTSVADLALAGVESVRVAFRLGIHVDRVSQSLESRDTNGQFGSWAYVVTGVSAEDVQAEINEYNIETVRLIFGKFGCRTFTDKLIVQPSTNKGLYKCSRQNIR